MLQQERRIYEFGPFQLDPDEPLLRHQGKPLHLTPKALQTLCVLIENQGRVVEKEELLHRVWPDTFVEESTLAQNVFTLRKQLGEDDSGAQYIETVPKRGYRFIVPVRVTLAPITSDIELLSARPNRRLRWRVWTGLGLAFVLAIGVLILRSAIPRRSSPPVSRSMLAVLPVENLSGDSGLDYLADGLTEEIIAQLGSLNPKQLGVIARTSSMAYRKTTKTVAEIGRELNVDYVVESSLRKNGDEVRFTTQLIRTADQTHLWAHSYERALANTLGLQAELANAIADEVRISLSTTKPQHIPPADAYDAFIQGRFHFNKRTPKEVEIAIDCYRRAIARDPDFAPAYLGLADSYSLLGNMREEPPQKIAQEAKDSLLKALSLDNSLASAHASLAWILANVDWNWSASEKEYEKALALGPNDAGVHHRYAVYLAGLGRTPEAVTQIRLARQLDPLSPVLRTSTGWILLRGRAPDTALTECRNALDLDPAFVRAHLCLGEAYEQKGQLDIAVSEFLQGRILAGEPAENVEALRKALAQAGYSGYFQERLKQLTKNSQTRYVSPYDFADIYVRLGRSQEAIQWLEAAYREHSPYLTNIQVEPRLDPLREDPRFRAIVQGLGLNNVNVEKQPLPSGTPTL
jgi:TolB-like protein/DNA-binding winged helix-turn-helix (wHTH) protein/Flp pilus assembly protein TadD